MATTDYAIELVARGLTLALVTFVAGNLSDEDAESFANYLADEFPEFVKTSQAGFAAAAASKAMGEPQGSA